MNIFLKDIINDKLVSWDFLIDDLGNTSIYNPYCKSSDYYTIFKHVILSLLLNKEIILLDSDFSEPELKDLTGEYEFTKFNINIEANKIKNLIFENKESLIEKLKHSSEIWKITLFTSGTTGIPKKVSHNFKSITRFVKITKDNNKSIWGFA